MSQKADQIEIVDRMVDAGLCEDNDVVWLRIGLQKSDIGSATSANQMLEMDYSQGFKRVDQQIISIISQQLHGSYDKQLGKPDINNMEQAFRRDLHFSGYNPEYVSIVTPATILSIPLNYGRLNIKLMENSPIAHTSRH